MCIRDSDKAIYQNHWVAGGNDTVWNMVHYDVKLFGGVYHVPYRIITTGYPVEMCIRDSTQ